MKPLDKTAKLIAFLLFLLVIPSVCLATNASKTPAPGAIPIAGSNAQILPGWLPASGLSNSGVYYCQGESDLIVAIGLSAKPLIQITGSFSLTANRTIPAGQTLWMPDGYQITTTGWTLTINGYFPRPGTNQIFAGTGTVVFGANALDYTADPAWFGGTVAYAATASANVIATLTANSATPSVQALAGINGTFQTNNSTATTITNFTNGVLGQKFTLIANDSYTSIQLGGQITGLQGATGAISLSQGDMIEFSYGGISNAYCTANGAPQACCTGSGAGICTGSNWHVMLVSSAGSSNLAYRNRFINGDMNIDQHNAGLSYTIQTACNQSAADHCFAVDRWFATATGATITATQATATPPFSHQVVLTGNTGNATFSLGQKIESLYIADLASSNVVLSAYIASSNLTSFSRYRR